MSAMTWGEFKKAVEEAGITDNTKIDYIDINYPAIPEDLNIVQYESENAFYISD